MVTQYQVSRKNVKLQRSRIPLAAEQPAVSTERLLIPSPGYLRVLLVNCLILSNVTK